MPTTAATIAHRSRYEERLAVTKRLAERGYTNRQIAGTIGITERSVERHRVVLGIAAGLAKVPIGAEEHAHIIEMLADGVSMREIARTIGRHETTISRRYKGMSKGANMSDCKQLRKKLGLLLT